MKRRGGESGYALLLVFLMAAMIAISLYIELPRVAFDTQRQKEDLLIYRGEQYKRAIEVFFKANKRYPAKIEDLESTNNRHYLRRRYKDPMTGKDEWRAVHTNGMTLTDSKVQTQQQKDQKKQEDSTVSTYLGAGVPIMATTAADGQTSAVNLALRRRDSDNRPGAPGTGSANPGDPNAPPSPVNTAGVTPGASPFPGQSGQPGQPGMPGMPPGFSGVPGVPPGVPGVPGQPGGTSVNPVTGTPVARGNDGGNSGGSSYLGSGTSIFGGSTTTPSGGMPSGQGGQPGFPPGGQPVNSQFGGVSPQQGNPFGGGFGANGPQMNPTAAGMINNLLTQPRPGGMPLTNTSGVQTMGGGIAGFASKVDEDSIMVYNDQTNYGLWEFIFDPNKLKPLPNPNTGPVGTPASQVASQSQGGQNPFSNPGQGSNPFSSQGQNPFGSQPQQNPYGGQPQAGPRQ